MSQNPNSAVDVIGIDIGKNSFHFRGRKSVELSCGCPSWIHHGTICRAPDPAFRRMFEDIRHFQLVV